jgi:hypothetical protein
MTSGAAQTAICHICGCLDNYFHSKLIYDVGEDNGIIPRAINAYIVYKNADVNISYYQRLSNEMNMTIDNHFPQYAGKLQKLILLK